MRIWCNQHSKWSDELIVLVFVMCKMRPTHWRVIVITVFVFYCSLIKFPQRPSVVVILRHSSLLWWLAIADRLLWMACPFLDVAWFKRSSMHWVGHLPVLHEDYGLRQMMLADVAVPWQLSMLDCSQSKFQTIGEDVHLLPYAASSFVLFSPYMIPKASYRRYEFRHRPTGSIVSSHGRQKLSWKACSILVR